MNLAPVKAFITARLGLRFEGGAGAHLAESLKQRMARAGAASAAAYLERLQTDDAELHELAGVLTIGETYFYREPQHLRLLTETLAPELLAGRAGHGKVRILSVGCATGEEPYSIVMALYERYGPVTERLFEITAVDIDRRALEKARAGLYGAFAFRALPVDLRERYFTAAGDQRRQIAEVIRRQVRLRPFNALTETDTEDLADQDVVFFRNVSLYFDAAARQTLQRRLQTLLKPGGHLIMGTTETLANNFGFMDLHQRNGVFLFTHRPARRRGDKQPLPEIPPAEKIALPPLPTPHRVPAPSTRSLLDLETAETNYQAALALARAERFEEALRRLDLHDAAGSPLAHHLTLRAHLLFEQGDAAGAAAATARALALDPGSVDALLLQGRIARSRGETKHAIDSLRQAIYHRPDCWPAHYHLAELYRESGETALARREYRIVLHQLQDDAAAARTAGSWPLAVAVKDLRFLCETRLARLDAAVG